MRLKEMGSVARPRKIAIWCLPGSYKENQVDRLPEQIRSYNAKGISIKVEDPLKDNRDFYQLNLERELTRRSRRVSHSLRRVINHQFHQLEISIFNDSEILHLPTETASRIQASDLIIIVLDETVLTPSPAPLHSAQKSIADTEEVGLRYLRERVKTTEHYLRYQEMLKGSASAFQTGNTTQKRPITVEDQRAAIRKILNPRILLGHDLAILLLGQIEDPFIKQTLQVFLEQAKVNKKINNIRLYTEVSRASHTKDKQHPTNKDIAEIDGFVELFLKELTIIEKNRVKRDKMVRWLFGNDTSRRYRPYERQTGNRTKKTKRMSQK
ncbi:MAG: hypothetical protein PHW11_08260 [Anaerolineaceae bacterium]|nr:hypothetical protein [Anaerolineaceae bacterium]MDD4043653.1 hypothetical protein [Anaerolineaceae bacterium]MDD4578377.1 hypothetical protein [Anaerolineaceae bacterium]